MKGGDDKVKKNLTIGIVLIVVILAVGAFSNWYGITGNVVRDSKQTLYVGEPQQIEFNGQTYMMEALTITEKEVTLTVDGQEVILALKLPQKVSNLQIEAYRTKFYGAGRRNQVYLTLSTP